MWYKNLVKSLLSNPRELQLLLALLSALGLGFRRRRIGVVRMLMLCVMLHATRDTLKEAVHRLFPSLLGRSEGKTAVAKRTPSTKPHTELSHAFALRFLRSWFELAVDLRFCGWDSVDIKWSMALKDTRCRSGACTIPQTCAKAVRDVVPSPASSVASEASVSPMVPTALRFDGAGKAWADLVQVCPAVEAWQQPAGCDGIQPPAPLQAAAVSLRAPSKFRLLASKLVASVSSLASRVSQASTPAARLTPVGESRRSITPGIEGGRKRVSVAGRPPVTPRHPRRPTRVAKSLPLPKSPQSRFCLQAVTNVENIPPGSTAISL